jgi:hypothetical protein
MAVRTNYADITQVGRHVEAGLIPGHPSSSRLSKSSRMLLNDYPFTWFWPLEISNSWPIVSSLPTAEAAADTIAHVFHARTAYTDFAPPRPRRHLLRLWLSTPVRDGGWKRPFPDGDEIKVEFK